MDAQKLLEKMLNSGKDVLGQGQEIAEDKLGVPDSGENRDAMMSGLGKGALAGGLLALLVGTKTGRKVSGKAIKYGSVAALAGAAYMGYKAWQSEASESSDGATITDLDAASGDQRGLVLIRAMISAANSDGHIDADERSLITDKLSKMDLDPAATKMLTDEIANPLSPEQIAEQIDSLAGASEAYLASSIVVDDANPQERDFLGRLATALKLPEALVSKLEAQAVA